MYKLDCRLYENYAQQLTDKELFIEQKKISKRFKEYEEELSVWRQTKRNSSRRTKWFSEEYAAQKLKYEGIDKRSQRLIYTLNSLNWEIMETRNMRDINNLRKEYWSYSEKVCGLWHKYKRIPKRGTPDGELRHHYIEVMISIEKEVKKDINEDQRYLLAA